ncbi:MAG: iron-sulfur protein [Methanosaeta sp. SDB]|nr:MAG: iron-sulfur protein [Methanosaeta sp. SDB]
MKILGINGSPRGAKSTTLKLVETVLNGAKEAGAETKLIDLCSLNIDYCDACGVCYKNGKCVHQDDFGKVYEEIMASDGLVLGSPVYFGSVTAQMKTMIDRMSDAIHCQLLLGKYTCSVSTAGSQGHQEVEDYINRIMVAMGASAAGSAGADMAVPKGMDEAIERAFKLGQTLVSDIENKTVYVEQEEIHRMMRDRFGKIITANKDEWTHEYEHWTKMGWL